MTIDFKKNHQRAHGILKKISFIIILLGLSFIVASLLGECTITAWRYWKHGSAGRAELITMRENMLQKVLGPAIGSDPNRNWENTLVIHPLFGYVYNSKLPGVNNFGFQSKYDILISKSGYSLQFGERDKVLTVGIFGGSFAQFTGSFGQYLEQKLATLFPERVPIVLNFGIDGHAMPQAAIVSLYFLELFDVVVFIDGLNEVWNAVENNKAGYPPEYAKAYHFHYKLSLNELSPERFILTSQIIDMKRRLAWASKISLLPGIRHSLLAHYIWRVFAKHWDYQIAQKSLMIKKGYEKGSKFFDIDNASIISHSVRQWETYHQLVHKIFSSRNILDIHLIQPNPFVENSKPLTSEEIDRINNSYNIKEYVVEGYPKLREAVASLKKEGLIVEDLSYIFKDIQEPIWDDAAHSNRFGYEIILDKIFEIIVKNKSSFIQSQN